MQSPIARKKHPSKTFVVKKNTQLFQSADHGNKRQKSQKMDKSSRRRGNFLDKQDAFQINKYAAKINHSSDSESDSDVSIGKSGKSESSESSIKSAKTIRPRSSKRIRGNLNQYTQDLFSTIIRKTESQKDQQKEEIQQKLFERMADKATAENYLLHQNLEKFDQPFKRSNQFSKDGQDSEHSFEIFSNLSNEDKQSYNSDTSVQIEEVQDQQRISQQRENSCHSLKMSIQTPNAEFSSTYFKPRVSNLRVSLAGFSPLQVSHSSQSSEDV
ncbi:unnamed protein product (macronuclear) [Paramecium tetraurelia]|uniref:Uncharacterized protein n=1 Tax=Paramecium tetraurelia TaxID=5888 RepID=A0BDK5_PARTE|nr:uncharacterized protein GSPATT00027651001 [Paramecium tetraurelia]CAK56622.1 unnamed protein product [Paramecium tetraurelia]|eukprot:XP_001424020.1 hypothetical protein (macronuclear) [Paramecium tetraurelia strain d4-2]